MPLTFLSTEFVTLFVGIQKKCPHNVVWGRFNDWKKTCSIILDLCSVLCCWLFLLMKFIPLENGLLLDWEDFHQEFLVGGIGLFILKMCCHSFGGLAYDGNLIFIMGLEKMPWSLFILKASPSLGTYAFERGGMGERKGILCSWNKNVKVYTFECC